MCWSMTPTRSTNLQLSRCGSRFAGSVSGSGPNPGSPVGKQHRAAPSAAGLVSAAEASWSATSAAAASARFCASSAARACASIAAIPSPSIPPYVEDSGSSPRFVETSSREARNFCAAASVRVASERSLSPRALPPSFSPSPLLSAYSASLRPAVSDALQSFAYITKSLSTTFVLGPRISSSSSSAFVFFFFFGACGSCETPSWSAGKT
mmetsp:Transcript_16177/g.52883  ORF Transcript_16177/g.52883 Transcript_16177/m.52883 type:complete len:209 (+) Transcript_16177:2690-3316(+)